MKVEFLTKYGLAAEHARLAKKPVMLLVSGQFAPPQWWSFLDPPSDDEMFGVADIVTQTGSAAAEFESMEDIDAWLSEVQSRLVEKFKDAPDPARPMLLVTIFDDNGNTVQEGLLHEFPTTFNSKGS